MIYTDIDKKTTDISNNHSHHRRQLDRIRRRADKLHSRDRLLVRMYIDHGATVTELARIWGLCSSTVYRRLRRAMRNLNSDALGHCLQHNGHFTADERAILRDYFLRDRCMSRTAKRMCVSLYRVRRLLNKLHRLSDS